MPQAEVVIDPLELGDITDYSGTTPLGPNELVPILRARFLEGIPYTAISPRVLVAVNPHQHIHANSDATLLDWAAEYADCGSEGVRGRLGPHIWALSGRAYYHMRRTGQDQVVILSGETGSGKTEMARLMIKSFIDLSLPPVGKKGSKLATSIPSAFFILDSFGHASAIHNTNASRFGRYTELQFSEKGRVIGLKGLEYYLEKSRVTSPVVGERNFHAFYYLLSGARPEERAHLKLDEATSFKYLSHNRISTSGSSADATRFNQLKDAFKAVGFPKKAVASVLQILAAILHLGNIEFHLDKNRNADSAVVKNVRMLETAAEFLGVEASELEFALTNKATMVSGERCAIFLDADGAASNRDDLAQSLYSLLFSWISEFLNEKLCRDDFSTFISLVDLPGPVQSSSAAHREGAGLDAFTFNLAAERMYSFTMEQLFEGQKAEYVAEGLEQSLPGLRTAYRSNSETTRLLTTHPGGLVHIIDDQSRRRGKTEATMLSAMSKRWGKHAGFEVKESNAAAGRAGSFTVAHWDGPVTYSAENLLGDNSAGVSPNFVTLLAGSQPKIGVHGRTTPSTRDQLSTGGSTFSFVRQLFTSGALETVAHPRNENTIVEVTQKVTPRRAPSTRRPRGRVNPFADPSVEVDEVDAAAATTKTEFKPSAGRSIVRDVKDSLSLLLTTIASTKSWHVYCLRPNDAQLPNQVDARLLKHQVRALGLAELAQRLRGEWLVNLEIKEWWDRYSGTPALMQAKQVLAPLMYRDKAVKAREILGFSHSDMAIGETKVFLNDGAFRYLEDFTRATDPEEQARNREKLDRDASQVPVDTFSPYLMADAAHHASIGNFGPYDSDAALPLVHPGGLGYYAESDLDYDPKGYFDEGDGRASAWDDDRSMDPSSGFTNGNALFEGKNALDTEERDGEHHETVEEVRTSASRKRWIALTWMFTWWIPSFCLSRVGGMKRRDVRMAWREKLLINMIIWFICGCAIFVIVVLGNLICPREYVFSTGELSSQSYSNDPDNMLVAIRGEVFDLTSFAPKHQPGTSVIPIRSIQKYGGTDATSIFPVQVSALCNGVTGTVSPWVTLSSTNQTSNTVAQYHDFRASTTDSRPDWYTETNPSVDPFSAAMIYLRYNFRKGFKGYTPKMLKSQASSGNNIAVIDGMVYDLTTYVTNGGGGVSVPTGQVAPNNIDRAFMSGQVVELFTTNAGTDITTLINRLNLDATVLARQKICLRNLFLVGKVDNRQSVQCKFSEYILIALSCFMVAIIGFKFLAALQFGRARKPENYDKFVICQVPCYTEGEDSLRACIDSLTKLKYDDKRKLLCIICDGMIVGSGNDRSTPQIVLDILGADPLIDPEPLSFKSIGEGAKQHNMAKVYSGLYEASGHIVPYVVLVKVGKPTERSRPGNRGKRDSQMMLMRFLNRVHFDAPMAPAELELYHQIKNVIGVNPSFYEYLLMVDADTVVEPYSLNHLVGAFVEDKKVIGLCGETSLSNAKASWTTMMQVYEYFISHHMAKAFESLFGTVTCLPGCFSVYRIRSVEHKPLIIADNVVTEYGENKVETLHVKNLLSLGEDRYLTTVMLKSFPAFKMKFCREAHAQTIAPDDWKVLMSQRRRWINSTVHNLSELMFIDKLCGFCCFSMRFIVFIDLLSTIIAPVTVAYIVYLIYSVAGEHKVIPTFALIMLAAIYGCQAVIYILHRKFEHIVWMIIYIIAIPFFSFLLPIVSFWQMDDFSWGSTREIVGEKGKRLIVHDEGVFDPASIPLKTWQDFENELWEQGSNESIGEMIAKREEAAYDGENRGQSQVYGHSGGGGGGEYYESNPFLGSGSQLGGSQAPPAFSSRGSLLDAMTGASPYVGATTTGMGARQMSGFPLDAMSEGPGGFAGSTRGVGLPSDERIVADTQVSELEEPLGVVLGSFALTLTPVVSRLCAVLASADLSTLTKKGVRQELEKLYGCDLGARKALVNQTISEGLGLL
ncbi:BZ3500_MvSof-1268-A1-R1_Chr6-3g08643 [Microbotryum saponariae]|uniref:chitin synthase n=1 Tax=Microbotryum saponariae TaxID=289078 RepID=A0A2X0KIG7_9BASI|nr:BZ3500_MvSof-1268-A1-R1_Chr6-3g08643 [Microbotryum saponariae]SDA07244.1 BZ3501_MvSof-1269-A2-R1_Chr6-2g08346 [Microbotryum saponariae]